MINGELVGVGIVSCGRPEMFKKLLDSLKPCEYIIDHICVFEDTLVEKKIDSYFYTSDVFLDWNCPGYDMGSLKNVGVTKAKNYCLQYLMVQDCDHIFLIEDDMFIKDPTVFEKYIKASKVSGIQHFNFSQHGRMNKLWPENTPNPRYIIDYGEIRIPFYKHIVGAFSYYSKKCLDIVGLMDERYYNAWDHVDHTFMIIKADMHPPFWTFADIEKSWEYLGDEEWTLENSLISSRPDHKQIMVDADKVFISKHGMAPYNIFIASKEIFGKSLKLIKNLHVSVLDSRWFEVSQKIQQVREEWEWMISKIEQNGNNQNILEIGCYNGGSSWYLNHFAKHMITIDNNIPCRFNPNDLGESYTYVGGDSHDSKMKEYFEKHEWDFVMIDGDHSYEGVKSDFYNILPYLKKGTPVAFHDIVISEQHHSCGCYVGEFWEDLKKEYKATKFEEYKSNTEWAGIGIIYV